MAAYYYFMFAFRRLFRASSEDGVGEWKAKTLLLLVDLSFMVNVGLAAFPDALDSLSPWVFGLAVAAPVAIANELIFSNQRRWAAYSKRFASLSKAKRRTADACVALVVVAAFVLPFVLRTLTTNLAWWQ
jgi:hypothetical protein